jgi:hypothetical protein
MLSCSTAVGLEAAVPLLLPGEFPQTEEESRPRGVLEERDRERVVRGAALRRRRRE